MEIDAYLSQPPVKNFIAYFREFLEGKTFEHRWVHAKSKTPWSCASLNDALLSYDWNGKDYHATAAELRDYRAALRSAVITNDNDLAAHIAIKVQDWGRTGQGRKDKNGDFVTGNIAAIKQYGSRFSEYLSLCEKQFLTDDAAVLDLNGLDLRSNAGFTKIYAVLLDVFCIYDSRVAAAVQLFVRRFCESERLNDIPDALAVLGLKERATSKRRNPSSSVYAFKYAYSDGSHYRWNIRLNWLLSESLRGTRFQRQNQSDSLRALEAGLFMIGYSVS